MSDFQKCTECGEFDWIRTHTCPPLWEVQIAEYMHDEIRTVRAHSDELAAEKFAELYDAEGDYPIVDGPATTVKVRRYSTDDWTIFEVEGETVPSYTATKVTR